MPCVKKKTIYNRDFLKGISYVNLFHHQNHNCTFCWKCTFEINETQKSCYNSVHICFVCDKFCGNLAKMYMFNIFMHCTALQI